MTTFTAILEQGDDQTWSAYTLSPSVVMGTGATREEAIADLRSGMSFWLEYLKETGQAVPEPAVEVISLEVAA